jgi:apolipoprotein N-acyltransferase
MTVLLSAFSAALCALSLPNEFFLLGSPPLGFICLVPLYLAFLSARSHREAALAGAVFGSVHHGLSSYWLYFYKGFALWTLGSTMLAYAVVYAVLGLYAWFLLKHERTAYRPFVFALGWAGFEYLKSTGFLGYPWGLLPYSLTQLPLLLQTSDRLGAYGASAFLALASSLVAEGMVCRKSLQVFRLPETCDGRDRSMRVEIIVYGLIALIMAGYGIAAESTEYPEKGRFRATLVQQNTDPWSEGEEATLESNMRLAREAWEEDRAAGGPGPDIFVFSETSLRRPYAEYRAWYGKNPAIDPVIPFIKETGSMLLTGAPIILDWEKWEATNSVLLIDAAGDIVDTYAKVHPVPFAEAIPMWEYEWFRTFMQEVVGLDSGWVMGDRLTVFGFSPRSSPGTSIRFSTPICFEDAFSDLCRHYFLEGADLLVNLTNDSWSLTKSAQNQHWAIARLRAIENRRTLVRSTNSGVTSIIDAHGRSLAELPQFEARHLTMDIPVQTGAMTLYTRYGDWFALLCLAVLVMRLAACFRRFRGNKMISAGMIRTCEAPKKEF